MKYLRFTLLFVYIRSAIREHFILYGRQVYVMDKDIGYIILCGAAFSTRVPFVKL